MKRKVLIGVTVVVVLFVGYFIVKGGKNNDAVDILVSAESGLFQVNVETTGELEAKNSVSIYWAYKVASIPHSSG